MIFASPRCTTSSNRGSFAQHDLERPIFDKEGTFSLSGHEAMERSIIRYATVAEVIENPNFAHEKGASGTTIDKVGYSPQGEKTDKDMSFFPNSWKYDKQDPSFAEDSECMGHGDRPEQLRWLQCVHRELLCGEQYSVVGARAGEGRTQHAVAAHRHLF